MNRTFCCTVLLATCFALLGCGPAKRQEAKKYPVSGTVTLDSKPIPDGVIYFKSPATGALDIVAVKDGKFQGEAEAGTRRVEINSFRDAISPEAKAMYGDKATPSKENVIPAKWNADSKLTAEVKESGPNEFQFAVTSK